MGDSAMSHADFDFYYHLDVTHASFNAEMRSNAKAEHNKRAPGCELSIFENVAGTEAIMKIRTEHGTYSPDWESAPFILQKMTLAEMPQWKTDVNFNGPSWNPEDDD
jgi:hypothetical protein